MTATDSDVYYDPYDFDIDSDPSADDAVFFYRLKNGQALNIEAVLNMLFNGSSPSGAPAITRMPSHSPNRW